MPEQSSISKLALNESHAMMLYRADPLRLAVEEFLVGPCGAARAKVAGDYRRRTELIEDLVFLVETPNFAEVGKRMQRYGGNAVPLGVFS